MTPGKGETAPVEPVPDPVVAGGFVLTADGWVPLVDHVDNTPPQ